MDLERVMDTFPGLKEKLDSTEMTTIANVLEAKQELESLIREKVFDLVRLTHADVAICCTASPSHVKDSPHFIGHIQIELLVEIKL
jgi:hypothetical protein